jgi:L-galactose dehydrogenase
VRFIGITGYPLEVLERLVRESRVGLDTCLSYCHLTLEDSTLLASSLLPLLEERGVGVINASPLAMGLLTDAGPPPWHPATPVVKVSCPRHGPEVCREVSWPSCVCVFGDVGNESMLWLEGLRHAGVNTAQAAEFCAARGVDIARLALHFTLSNKRLACTLVSMASLKE